MTQTALNFATHTIDKALRKLQKHVDLLESQAGIPLANENGPIAMYFSNFVFDPDEGLIKTIDDAWTHVFQRVADSDRVRLS